MGRVSFFKLGTWIDGGGSAAASTVSRRSLALGSRDNLVHQEEEAPAGAGGLGLSGPHLCEASA